MWAIVRPSGGQNSCWDASPDILTQARDAVGIDIPQKVVIPPKTGLSDHFLRFEKLIRAVEANVVYAQRSGSPCDPHCSITSYYITKEGVTRIEG